MIVVVSIGCCSLQIVQATVAPNFTSVPILLHFPRHMAKEVAKGGVPYLLNALSGLQEVKPSRVRHGVYRVRNQFLIFELNQ